MSGVWTMGSTSTPKRPRGAVACQSCSASPLPFAVTGSRGSYSKSFSRHSVRALADDDAADGRMLLQSCRGVHDVARDHSFSFRGPRAQCDHRLAAVHGPANCEFEIWMLGVELVDRGQDAQRRVHRALGIVFVRDRRTEDRHDSIADELLHRPAEPLDLLLHTRVVRTQTRADILRIGLLGRRGEPDEVDEENGDDLALFGCASWCFLEGGAARRAEARPLGVLLATVRTPHTCSLRRHGYGA